MQTLLQKRHILVAWGCSSGIIARRRPGSCHRMHELRPWPLAKGTRHTNGPICWGEKTARPYKEEPEKKCFFGDAALPGWWCGAGTSIPVSPRCFGPREAQRLPFSQVLLFATQQRNKNEPLSFKIKWISAFTSFFSCCQKLGQGDGLNNCFSGKCNLTLLLCSALPFLTLIFMMGRRTQKLLWHTRRQFMLLF